MYLLVLRKVVISTGYWLRKILISSSLFKRELLHDVRLA
jgi:hypothetical protein